MEIKIRQKIPAFLSGLYRYCILIDGIKYPRKRGAFNLAETDQDAVNQARKEQDR